MSVYIRNRLCRCQRCTFGGLIGAGILITLGFLFLLDNYGVFDFDKSSPLILIVIGLLLFARRNASTEGHIQAFGLPSTAPTSGQRNNSQVNP
ncbi:MAG TPA: DUF5668 domain-containing protein [Candidatus Angelobacter sp.]|jgi:hypothetical protein|nr:DUF5668 domain-containing protein [Candidatus Angelobacter sp.]